MARHDREGFEFDLRTQRFLVRRWETATGRAALAEITAGIRNGTEIRAILGGYVLEHVENSDPYGHPFYPPDAMTPDAFWVLTQDDLRGATFSNENFAKSNSLEKKDLSYGRLFKCDLTDASLERVRLSSAKVEECTLVRATLAGAIGFSTRFRKSDLRDACFWDAGLIEADFSGADLRGVYFEHGRFADMIVDYETRFDERLRTTWSTRTMAATELPELLKAIRLAYQRQEIWTLADRFLALERAAFRKAVLWPAATTPNAFARWGFDIVAAGTSGYGTLPGRVATLSALLWLGFAALFVLAMVPKPTGTYSGDVLQALYFSAVTFITLGFGDVTYTDAHPWLRALSASEAWIGAIFIALFVTTLARKAFR